MPKEQTTSLCAWSRKTEAGGQAAKWAERLARSRRPEFCPGQGHQRPLSAQLWAGPSHRDEKMLVKDKETHGQENDAAD